MRRRRSPRNRNEREILGYREFESRIDKAVANPATKAARIRETRTGPILFLGRVCKPAASAPREGRRAARPRAA